MTIRRLAVGMALVAVAVVAMWLLTRDASPPPATRAAQPQGAVLFIPGYGGGTAQIEQLADQLTTAGIDSEVIPIGDGTADLRTYADLVSDRARALVASGQPAPDLVGYSAGGVVARIAATQQPELYRKVVTLGSPHQGTTAADAGALFGQCPPACQQLRTDSPLLAELPEPAHPSDWLSLWSDTDAVIRPPDSSQLAGVVDYRLQQYCGGDIEHGALPTHPQSVAVVTAFLSGQALPSACVAS